MEKQILLIQPPIEDFYATDCRTQPLGLCYISASIKQEFPEIEVIVYDAFADGKKQNIPWPLEFGYLKKYYGHADNSPFKLFHQYSRFGKSNGEIRNDIKIYSPFLIGISSMFTAYYRQSLEMAALCRELFPEAKIVMGGNHAAVASDSLLQAHFKNNFLIDYVISGEAELAMNHLIKSLLKNQNLPRGLIDHLQTPDINQLPYPDFSSLDFNNYHFNYKPMCFIVTSRSCPYRCSFCGIHSIFGNKYRRRDNADILNEIQVRVDQGIRHIDIEDDHFSANKKETHDLLDQIIKKNWPLSFSAMNGMVYWSLDDALLVKMKNAGFHSLNLSLVSKNSRFLQNANRPSDDMEFADIVKTAHKHGFLITAYFIIGMPGQTIEEMTETLRFLSSLPVLIGASPYYLCPGTPDYKKWNLDKTLNKASGQNDSFFSARLTALDIETPDFNRDDIYTLFKMTRLINHIKNGIDHNYPPDHDFYKNIYEIFKEKKWYALAKTNKAELPISKTVIESILSKSINIYGYKTQNNFNFNHYL
ncbi:MAG: radical SAM protein [Spirochaetia bacterium]|nr:radical SAM protein [Spirochaetia bacterium]